MNAIQIQLVQSTFDQVKPMAATAAAMFYGRLFQLDPSLRPLFRGDLLEQGKKLMAAIALVVANLNQPQRILPTVQDLGRRHVAYGVQPHHYATVGEALLWTLETALGEEFSAEAYEAWAAAYGLLSSVMQEAAQHEPLPA